MASSVTRVDGHQLFLGSGGSKVLCLGVQGKVTNLDKFKQQITAAVETVTSEMLKCVWAEISYQQDISRATKGAHTEIY